MAIQFDVTSRPDFLPSVLDIDANLPQALFDQLKYIEANETWDQFTQQHGWAPVPIEPIDSYPGAPDYYSFELTVPPGRALRIVGFLNRDEEVFCAVAIEA